MEAEQRQQAIAAQPPGSSAAASWSATYTTRTSREIMDTDVRLEDAERARARYDSNVAGLDSMFEQAMAMKNKSYRKTCPRLAP